MNHKRREQILSVIYYLSFLVVVLSKCVMVFVNSKEHSYLQIARNALSKPVSFIMNLHSNIMRQSKIS
jgi:hypothetical protein